jgi:hypothetical protein
MVRFLESFLVPDWRLSSGFRSDRAGFGHPDNFRASPGGRLTVFGSYQNVMKGTVPTIMAAKVRLGTMIPRTKSSSSTGCESSLRLGWLP